MRGLILVVFFLSAPDALSASAGDAKVMAMLKTNSIVQAAVAQAKKWSGAKSCEYSVHTTELTQFNSGTGFEFEAEINCFSKHGDEEASSSISVTGQLIDDSPQALTLEIGFAG